MNSVTTQNNSNKKINYTKIALAFFATGLMTTLSTEYYLYSQYENKFLPNTNIDGINISGLTKDQALLRLEPKSQLIANIKLSADVVDIEETKNFTEATSSSSLKIRKDYIYSIDTHFSETHSSNVLQNIKSIFFSYFKPKNVKVDYSFDKDVATQFINVLNQKIEIVGEDPKVTLKTSENPESITVFEGKMGRKIDSEQTIKRIDETINNKNFDEQTTELNIKAEVVSTSTVLNEQEIKDAKEMAKKYVGKAVVFKSDDRNFKLIDTEIVNLLDPVQTFSKKNISELVAEWHSKIAREPQDATFEYDKETLEVTQFVPHKDGLALDIKASELLVLETLKNIQDQKQDEIKEQTLTVQKTAPKMSLKGTNNLGINERIGFGESYYHHSIPNRVHNVDITAKRVNLHIIKPNEEFSFNKTIGEISAKTGYKSAYVISGGKTVLGDGGGVCQVSSTLFRAVLNAGLDVTRRLQHSYRVSYYELNSDPGFDATVYSGNVDFRFKNDTENHVLVYTENDPEELYLKVELYGTSDGRTAEITDYKKWDFRSPPAPEYYPTTELPSGKVRQIDWAVSGIKTEFTHTVKDKDGNVKYHDKYYSNYRPWSAKYMRGI